MQNRKRAPQLTRPITIATRESRLALWQAEHVRDLLKDAFGVPVTLLGMTTQGDRILDVALSKIGGKGLFVKELETALAEKRADLAVHSLKDVPMNLPDGFALATVMVREDARDAFVSPRYKGVLDLPQGARVGTSSLRRVTQLHAVRPDLVIEPLRGNLDTRLRKLDEGQHDAIILAAAGLKRLGMESRIAGLMDLDTMVPAAGQAALAIEIRSSDTELAAALQTFTHQPTWLAVHAERAVSRALGGSCSMPLAAHAQWQGSTMHISTTLGHPTQPQQKLLRVQAQATVTDNAGAQALGQQVAAQLMAQPAAQAYLDAAR
jgi:hydroxymethylbilane synthase